MEEQFKGKSVPYSQLEEYLSAHNILITSLIELQKSGVMTQTQIEELLPSSLFKLRESLTKILKENNVIQTDEEESKDDKLKVIIKTVMQLQNSLLSQNAKNQVEIKSLIECIRPEIESAIGQQQPQILQELTCITAIIEENLSEIKDMQQNSQDEVINQINEQNERIFAHLREQLDVKDAQINGLKVMEGELKGKNETIEILKQSNAILKQQLDSQVPLQNTIDQLKTQNLQIEGQLQSFKEKAT